MNLRQIQFAMRQDRNVRGDYLLTLNISSNQTITLIRVMTDEVHTGKKELEKLTILTRSWYPEGLKLL